MNRLITADSIEEQLINLQTFKKYIANNVVDEVKITETNLNVNNFMESFEDFSSHKLLPVKKNTEDQDRDINDEKEELELEYLKKFL